MREVDLSLENANAEQIRRTEQIFHDVLVAPPSQRDTLLASRCQGDTALMAELSSLLAACEAEEALSTQILSESAAGQLREGRRAVGPYALDRLLGRGGMGAVYLAHRIDGEFEQEVAIKVIDLPLATGLFRDRFRQERQILAGLVHPFIARLLDGGVTEDGEPYLAMEYVDGVSLMAFCKLRTPSQEQRLRLFRDICGAVQFAHQNLIVHRDLKPDNILVVEDGTPRLLDFGTAKLLATSSEMDVAQWTRQGLQAFTPQYASPEQVLGETITTASDIYSLGVLLYLLIAGGPPYELKEFNTAEMLRLICQEQPPRPSSRAPKGTVDPDLDAIVMKALRKEPSERYATVNLLSADLQAFLERRPVQAQRGSSRYLATKFVLRNRLAIGAACLLCFTVLIGMGGVLWQSRQANLQWRRAEARSADLRELSNSLLTELDNALKDIPGSTGAQKILVSRVLEHLDHMATDSQGGRESALDLIGAYTHLGEVQGNTYAQNLGDTAGALASFDKALVLARRLVEANPNDKDALRSFAQVSEQRGETLTDLGRVDDAVASLRDGASTYEKLIALPGVTPKLLLEASTATQTLGDELCEDQGMADAAAGLAAYRRSLALDERAQELDPTYLPAQRGPAYIHLDIGNVELETDPLQAMNEFQLGLQILDALPAAEQSKLFQRSLHATLRRKEAAAYTELGQYARAVPLFEETKLVYQQLLDSDPKGTLALGEMQRLLDVEASCFEYAADPRLAEVPGDRRKNLQAAAQLLEQDLVILHRVINVDPSNAMMPAELASIVVRLGAVRSERRGSAADAYTAASLAALKRFAERERAPAQDLNLAATAYLAAEPASLRNPKLAVAFAEQGVFLTHRKSSGYLLLLAQAYRADGQIERAENSAKEGLLLLPGHGAGSPRTRMGKLLAYESRRSTNKS